MTFTNNFSERIAHVRRLIAEADYILIGAGAGLSAAAGLNYTGADFEREFKPWIERYGITDLYSSSSILLKLKKNAGPTGPNTFGLPAIAPVARPYIANFYSSWPQKATS